MVSYLFGLESMCYLTTGLVDAGVAGLLARVGDLQGRRDRVPLVPGEPRAAARRRRGLHARRALREDPARHPDLPDLRGRQRCAALVRRAHRRSSRSARSSPASANIGLGDPIGSLGVLADYVGGSARVRPDKITMAPRSSHATPTPSPIRSSACVDHREAASRAPQRDRPQGPSPPPPVRRARRHLRPDRGALPGDRALRRAGRRALGAGAAHRAELLQAGRRRVTPHLDQIEHNDDEHITAIAKLAYKRGSYGYALCD